MDLAASQPAMAVERQACTVTIEGTGQSFAVEPGDSILSAALRSGLGFPYECSSGGCGSCKVELVSGEVECPRPDASGLQRRDWERGKRLACQCFPLSACRIKVRLDDSYVPRKAPLRHRVQLVEVVPLTHDLWEFRFAAPGGAAFLPGQYALLTIPGVAAPRAYSMCNCENHQGEWSFQIKRVPDGAATSALFDELRPGAVVELDGPYGTAFLQADRPRDIVCIAGGSGLAPMLSIVRGALNEPALAGRTIHLFYGGREPRDIVDPIALGLPARPGDLVRFFPVISEGKTDAAAQWSGARGFVHEMVEQHFGGGYGDYEYYLAGPPPMVEAVRRMLVLGKSVPVDQIHYDRFF